LNLAKFLWWMPVGRVAEISPDELKRKLDKGWKVQLVDARSELEFRQGTVNRAHHAPVTGVPGTIKRLELDPARPVVVLCASGHRSIPGTRWLRANGYEAYSLKGGVMGWRRAGFPLKKPKKQ
jgi:rhodanese-related sulfurtransferase